MAYLQLYKDSFCTNLFMTIPVAEITCEPSRAPSTLTYDGKSYKYFDWNNSVILKQVPIISQNPPFLTSRNRVPTSTTMYFKNGVIVNVQESTSSGRLEHFKFGNNDLAQSNNSAATESEPEKLFAISFSYQGTKYMGFTGWFQGTQPNYFRAICCVEAGFWEKALRPAYDYGTKPDGDGGQGDGKIPHTPIGFSSKPTISLPTGANGLHAYRINTDAYDDLQSYLWGQNSTLAKNLWQKFVNSKTNPAGCVVACYRLPALFMPSGSVVNGIRLAGVKAPITNGVVQEVVLGFTDYVVKIGHVDAPFKSWADYCGATVTISIPLCGEFTTPLEKVWNKDVFVKYRIDLSNGNLVGMTCSGTCADDGSSYSMEYLLGEMSGNVAYNVPISGGDDGTLARIGAVFGGISNVVSGFVGGVQDLSSVVGAMGATGQTGSPVAGSAGFSSVSRTGAMASRGAHYLSDIIMPPFQSHLINPNLSGNMSACSNGIAYAEYQIACIAYPPNYGDVMGYPARSSGGLLRDFQNGYGEFYVSAKFDIHGATYEEKEEIVALLESGVFV